VTALQFRCTGCGNCCRDLRVAITAQDLMRLTRATGRPAHELIDWLGPDVVELRGESESFVELRGGPRLMVLAQQASGCVLLDASDRCRAYDARPRDCRTFPFDFERTGASERTDARRLDLLPLVGCDHASDGHNDASALEREDAERWRELARYRAIVARWNRAVFHRRRLGRSSGDEGAFVAFALRESDARE